MHTDNIAKFFAAFQLEATLDKAKRGQARIYLVLLEPLFQQLFAALSEDGTSQFERFVLVEPASFEQNTEILQDWR